MCEPLAPLHLRCRPESPRLEWIAPEKLTMSIRYFDFIPWISRYLVIVSPDGLPLGDIPYAGDGLAAAVEPHVAVVGNLDESEMEDF